MTQDQLFDQFLQDNGFTEQPFGIMVKLRKAFDAGRSVVATSRPCPACLGSGNIDDVPKRVRLLLDGYEQQKAD